MNKHTPGPWYNDGLGVITGGVAGLTTVAETPKARWLANERFEIAEQAEANASLIAAAPDLLAALEEAERVIRWAAQEAAGRVDKEKVGGWLHHADQARSVIAKAKGV